MDYIKNTKQVDPYKNTDIKDIDGEEWVDVIGYDGMYCISNYGRVKSMARHDNIGRKIKERILKQVTGKMGNPTVVFSVDNIKKTQRIIDLVGMMFIGDKKHGEVYYHKNKIKHDNRLTNISRGTHSKSTLLGIKLGVNVDWGIGEASRSRRIMRLEKLGVYENGELVGKICPGCMRELPLTYFYERKELTGVTRVKCKECVLKIDGVKDLGKRTNSIDMGNVGLRKCWKCGEIKSLDTEFYNHKKEYLGKSHTCKKCAHTLHKNYIENKKLNINNTNKQHEKNN